MNRSIVLPCTLLSMWLTGIWYVAKNYCCISAPVIPLAIIDGATPVTTSNNNLLFSFGGHIPNIATELQDNFQSVADYLKNNPNKDLRLNGKYNSEENNNTTFADLGLARADQIKQLLVGMGAPADRISTTSSVDKTLVFINDETYGGIGYNFISEEPKEENRVTDVGKQLSDGPIIIYFEKNKGQAQISPADQQLMLDLQAYLEQNPDEKIRIIGHTDNSGDRDYNLRLSQKRADYVTDFILGQNKIQKSRITSIGKGPDEPLNSNITKADREANRRVEVIRVKK